MPPERERILVLILVYSCFYEEKRKRVYRIQWEEGETKKIRKRVGDRTGVIFKY